MNPRTLLLALCSVLTVAAQPPLPAPQPRRLHSPQVNADRTVKFEFRDPNAKEVMLTREGAPRLAMQKDDDGVWSVTTPALDPDFYGYSFIADGVQLMDPMNPNFKPNLIGAQSVMHVPGPPALPWEVNDVPHGTIHHHFYKSAIVGDERDFYVYTPPAYDPKAKRAYPVLYLLHGFSDDASGWTAVGHANVILDNLIAQGKAKPMLVVMTLGYGAPEIVTASMREGGLRERNMSKYRDALFEEVIPQVEKDYTASKDRKMRAIAGLSMGGAESLYVGLNAINRFAWIGAFSAGGLGDSLEAQFPSVDSKANDQLKLLWVACGTDDRLIEANRKFLDFLTTKSLRFTRVETPGAHTWMVWRRNLAEFTPLLFQ